VPCSVVRYIKHDEVNSRFLVRMQVLGDDVDACRRGLAERSRAGHVRSKFDVGRVVDSICLIQMFFFVFFNLEQIPCTVSRDSRMFKDPVQLAIQRHQVVAKLVWLNFLFVWASRS